MGVSIMKRCDFPGCPNKTKGRYCDDHKQEVKATRKPDERESASKRGYDREWQRKRRVYLAKHPMCEDCLEQGKVVIATDVDHIDGNVRNMQENNFRALCHSCHSRKTWRENGSFGRKKKQ